MGQLGQLGSTEAVPPAGDLMKLDMQKVGCTMTQCPKKNKEKAQNGTDLDAKNSNMLKHHQFFNVVSGTPRLEFFPSHPSPGLNVHIEDQLEAAGLRYLRKFGRPWSSLPQKDQLRSGL